MKNVVKTVLLTFVFTVIVIGLFGISTVSMVNDVLAEKDKQGKNSNTEGSTATRTSSKNGSEKCTSWDPRC
ncbi:MAG: hypothetical protein ACXWE0_00785 [Nitrososphaeraceae archaeon]